VKFLNAGTYRKLEDARKLESDIESLRNVLTPGINYFFIIDEIHRMTSQAISALLQPFEDVPENVYIIATTTDIEKLMADEETGKANKDGEAFLSRFQVFNFHPLDRDTTVNMLMDLSAKHGMTTLTREVAGRIYDLSKGIPRDSIKILEMYLSHGILEAVQKADKVEAESNNIVELFLQTAVNPESTAWYKNMLPSLRGILDSAANPQEARVTIIKSISHFMFSWENLCATDAVKDNPTSTRLCIKALEILFTESEALLVYPMKSVMIGRMLRAYNKIKELKNAQNNA